MAATAMFPSPSAKSLGSIREILGLNNKDSALPDLKRALSKLSIANSDELEHRLLSLDAFLRPWSVFRDSILFHHPDALSHPTVLCSTNKVGISRADILWFYTQFDEGALRYDPRADESSPEYTADISVHGVIDKSTWRLQEHEKHLFAWLLQELKVGKASNPWGLKYFELKSVCVAWEEVLVPVVNAVRASYDPRGRHYYGRLALYIEQRCPSGLAFPDSNVSVPQGSIMSPTPYRVVSMPKKPMNSNGATLFSPMESGRATLAKKHYDETERELRNVYPQYGGLVERPKFKQRMEEWLAEQQVRAEQRKKLEHRNAQETNDLVVRKRGAPGSPIKRMLTPLNMFGRSEPHHSKSAKGTRRSRSPVKRYSDSLRRSLSLKPSPKRDSTKDEDQKSPLHGVTRQLQFPEDASSPAQQPSHRSSALSTSSRSVKEGVSSQERVCGSIGNSNQSIIQSPAQTDGHQPCETLTGTRHESSTQRTEASPQDPVTDHNEPLHHQHPALRSKKSYHDSRLRSYEGTGYQQEISLTDLHDSRKYAARTPQPPGPIKFPTRLPAPIAPVPYSGKYRIACRDSNHRVATGDGPLIHKSVAQLVQPSADLPRSRKLDHSSDAGSASSSQKAATSAWEDAPPPKAVPWPGADSDSNLAHPDDMAYSDYDSDDTDVTPPIPPKSPQRQHHPAALGSSRRDQLIREESNNVQRIISKDNIRAALGGDSRNSLVEDLPIRKPFAEPARMASPAKSLRTYNSNLFPRKD